jgi:Tfp pilus assembly protein PilO
MALGWRESYYRYKEFFLNISALYKQKADLRAFLEIILSLSTITVFLLFALKPTALTIINLLREINEKRQTLASLTQKLNNLQTANNLLTQNQSIIPDINTAVPDSPNPDTLSKQVEGLSAKDSTNILGITVNQVALIGSFSPTKSSSGLKPLPKNAREMPFSISISGNYPSLISFIKDFSNLRIVVAIDSLGISSSITDKGRVIVAVISGRTAFLENQ